MRKKHRQMQKVFYIRLLYQRKKHWEGLAYKHAGEKKHLFYCEQFAKYNASLVIACQRFWGETI